MSQTSTPHHYLILQVGAAVLTLFTAIMLILYFVPSKQRITKIQPVTVPQAEPVKITSLDVDLTYNGNPNDFEDLLNDHENPNNNNFTIDNVSFNEANQDIDLPSRYLNTTDDDQTLNSLLTQPHYVGQKYYQHAQHPAVKVTVNRSNIFGQPLKTKTTEHNRWPKDLQVGQTINNQTFTTKNHQLVNDYETTSYFTKPTTEQNTVIHVTGNYKLGKYPHSWTGNYQIIVDPQTHKLTWTRNSIDYN